MTDTLGYRDIPYYTDLTCRTERAFATVRELWNAVSCGAVRGSLSTAAASAMLMRYSAESCDGDGICVGYELRKTADALLSLPGRDAVTEYVCGEMRSVTDTGTAAEIRLAAAEKCSELVCELTGISERIADNGYGIIKECKNILVIGECGAYTALKLGTALAPVYRAHEMRADMHVYCCRGAESGNVFLTDLELSENGIEHLNIPGTDMAFLMSSVHIDALLAPADDRAAEHGILQAAIVARHYGVPLYICAPGRLTDSVRSDVRALTSAFVTEHGVFRP